MPCRGFAAALLAMPPVNLQQQINKLQVPHVDSSIRHSPLTNTNPTDVDPATGAVALAWAQYRLSRRCH